MTGESGRGPRNILSNVVSDALTVARSRETALSAARFQIGRYEFCEPDYSEILIWAKALEIDPEAFVQQLGKTSFTQRARSLYRSEARDISEVTTTVFKVERGAIVSLAWDFFHLRIKTFDWVSGLSIQAIAVFDQFALDYAVISFSLPFLRSLFIGPIHLTKVDLSKVRGSPHWTATAIILPNSTSRAFQILTELFCGKNRFTKLDLSSVPNLNKLSCGENQLTELDLSGTPNLTKLRCDANQFTELDLSNVPGLNLLYCHNNELTELDLSAVPNLSELVCRYNQLTELDLSAVPKLTELDCGADGDDNKLTELDLSGLSSLTKLRCYGNKLSRLDLSNVPSLYHLSCASNQLTELDISNVPRLTMLYCSDNQLTELELSHVPNFTKLNCANNRIAELDVRANTALTELRCDPSVDVTKLPSQNFKRYE